LFELLRDLQGPNLQTAPPLSTMPHTIAKMALCCTCLPEGVRPSIEGVGRTGPDRYDPQQPRNGHERRDSYRKKIGACESYNPKNTTSKAWCFGALCFHFLLAPWLLAWVPFVVPLGLLLRVGLALTLCLE